MAEEIKQEENLLNGSLITFVKFQIITNVIIAIVTTVAILSVLIFVSVHPNFSITFAEASGLLTFMSLFVYGLSYRNSVLLARMAGRKIEEEKEGK